VTAVVHGLRDSGTRERLAEVLHAGGIVIMPCDTIYGIVGRVPATEDRIRAAKGRGADRPFIQLIGEAAWLPRLTSAQLDTAVLGLWPGPLTLVVPALGGGTVAVRHPADDLLLHLLRRLDCPLYSTSVNRAGEAPLTAVAEMVRVFGPHVDLVVDAGDQPRAHVSTVLDVTTRPYRILRQGAVRVSPELLRGR
jgi:L-threonylcarbamoyladenylate synthase